MGALGRRGKAGVGRVGGARGKLFNMLNNSCGGSSIGAAPRRAAGPHEREVGRRRGCPAEGSGGARTAAPEWVVLKWKKELCRPGGEISNF